MFLDWIFQQLTPKSLHGPARHYGNGAIGLSCAIALVLILQGANVFAFALPVIALGTVAYQSPFFAALQTAFTIFLLDSVSFFWTPERFGGFSVLEAWVVFPIMIQLIFTLRCLAFGSGMPANRKRRIVDRDPNTFQKSEIYLAVLIVLVAFSLACLILISLEFGTFYAPFFALLPQGLRIVQLIVTLAILFLVLYCFLVYIKNRSMDRMEATMVLQHAVWKWFGREQEMIIKARTKQKKRLQKRSSKIRSS